MRASGDSDLKLYGIFGFPLAHTLSPIFQNAAFEHCGLKSVYLVFERTPERFRFLMKHLNKLLLDGFNVTVPHKETVLRYLDRVSPEAKAIGAVNTVKKEGRKWTGYNTDYSGFLESLKQKRFSAKGKDAVILGAGGSARAVGYALGKSGIRSVLIANRTVSRAKHLSRELGRLFPKTDWYFVSLTDKRLKKVLEEARLLVNTTKVGLKPSDPSILPKSFLPKKKILVYDLIYRPRMTKLLKQAKQMGHSVLNGEDMLLYQGARAFEIWTGKKAPLPVMRKALHDAIVAG